MFNSGVIEGYYDQLFYIGGKDPRITARTKKSHPGVPAYEAGYERGFELAKAPGAEIPQMRTMMVWYQGWKYGDE